MLNGAAIRDWTWDEMGIRALGGCLARRRPRATSSGRDVIWFSRELGFSAREHPGQA